MVAVKSNYSLRNRTSPKVVGIDGKDKITPLRRRRDKAMVSKLSNNEAVRATKEAGTLASKSEREAIAVIALPEPKPMWLRSLAGLQTVSSIVTLLIACGALSIYAGTIYGQAKWSKEYQKLEKVRRYEQQLSVANELLKHEIAEQAASQDVGLVPQDSIEPIFLSPVPLRSALTNSNSESKSSFEIPLAY